MTKLKLVAGIIGAFGIQCIAYAGDTTSSKTVISNDLRVDANTYPWSSVGKLNNGSGGSCTAVLISPHYALTAAHCLYFKATARFLPAESIHLVFGYQKQGFREHVRIAGYHVANGYDPSAPYESLASDWALLSIASPSGTMVASPIGNVAHLSLQPHLMTGGYSHQVPYAMTADHRCQMLGRSLNKKFLFDTCSAPSGYSGAPLFTLDPATQKIELAGIHVAHQTSKEITAAVAIPMESIWPEVRFCVEGGHCHFTAVAGAADPPASEILVSQKSSKSGAAVSLCNTASGACRTSLTGP